MNHNYYGDDDEEYLYDKYIPVEKETLRHLQKWSENSRNQSMEEEVSTKSMAQIFKEEEENKKKQKKKKWSWF